MQSAGRILGWIAVVLCALAAVGLVLVAVLMDLEAATLWATVAGAVAALAGVAISVRTLMGTSGAAGRGGRGSRHVSAGGRGVAAGGDISGNAIGNHSSVRGRPGARRSSPSQPRSNRAGPDVRTGRKGIAAGGDVADNAIGNRSEVDEQ